VAAVLSDRGDLAEDALRGGGSHRDHEGGPHRYQFALVPLPAGPDLGCVRFLVQAGLSAWQEYLEKSFPYKFLSEVRS
jgi:hypothetical protein